MTKVLIPFNRYASLFQSILALADEASQTGTRSAPAGDGLNEFDLDGLLDLFDRAGNLRVQLANVIDDAVKATDADLPERIARITRVDFRSGVADRQPGTTPPVGNSADGSLPALSLSSQSAPATAPDESTPRTDRGHAVGAGSPRRS